MRLWLVVQPARGEQRDLAVEVDPSCPTQKLVDALAEHVGLNGGQVAAYSRSLGRWLDGAREVAEAGLRSGDLLVLAAAAAARGRTDPDDAPPFELRVIGGPVAGTTIGLAAGEHLVGRGTNCTVHLDDPSLSREHIRLHVGPDAVEIEDAGSSNGTFLDGEPVHAKAPLEPGRFVLAGRTYLTVERRTPREAPTAAGPDGSVPFNRPPRVAPRFSAATLELPAAPEKSQRPRLPLATSLVPLGGGLALWAMTKNPISLVFAALTPVMALWTFLEDRRRGRKTFGRQTGKFEQRLESFEQKLATRAEEEVRFRRTSAPDAADLLARARRALPNLWERRPTDEDFLDLRVGIADRPSLTSVSLPDRGEDELRARAEAIVDRFRTVQSVPVPVSALEGPIGLAGSSERVASLGRWFALQAATLHSPRDLAIAATISNKRLPDWEWLKWVPHTRVASPTGEPMLALGSSASRELLGNLARLLEERKSEVHARFAAAPRRPLPVVLAVIDEEAAPDLAALGPLLAEGSELGICVVWLGSDPRTLPGECRTIVELEKDVARLRVTNTVAGEIVENVTGEGVSVGIAREAALALAPVVDRGAAAGARQIPRRVTLLELLEAEEASPAVITGRWRAGGARPTGPLGVGDEGVFEVDLVRDGPHALVGGTTGAGKSELLQTLVASLAVTTSPDRLTFLLVDYKGGAAFKECVELPHTVGFVTDLDAHLTRRARISLNAELKRREEVLRAAGAKDLAEMARRDPDRAPASLLIVIDEFATLVNEVPEFVEAVVDVAQRGRTLGLHLVLATQRPRGAITENIRANTNLRIAMRVGSAAESEDVIGAPDAARIPRSLPGRAFALTGHGELAEFQTAFVGGLTQARREGPSVAVADLRFNVPARDRIGVGDSETESSDLRELVRAVSEAAETARIARQPSPWLPPLPNVVPLATLEAPESGGALGLVDEPSAQRQRPLVFDPEREGSLLVYGTTGSGKTTLLRTLAVALASKLAPDELHVYGLDFATRGLEPLRGLPHCAGVVPGDDEELVARTFALLRRAIAERKDAVARTGAGTLSELHRHGIALPRLLVLLDGYSAFVAAYDRISAGELVEALPRLVADGRALGVHLAIAADRRGAVRSALAGSVETRIVLRMADEDEYAALGVDTRAVRGAVVPPGRGFLGADLEVQCALVGDEPAREAAAVAEAAAALADRYQQRAPSLARLPAEVPRDSLPSPSRALEAMLGLSDEALAPAAIRLDDGSFLVAGPRRSGRTTALATIASSLRAGGPDLPLHLVVPRRSSLPELGVWTSVAIGRDEAETFLTGLAETVAARTAGGDPIVLVVDDGTELTEGRAATALETIARRGRDVEVWIVAAVEANAAHRTFGGWLRELRNEEHGVLLDPQLDVDGDLLGVRLARAATRTFPPGRGFLVRRGAVELVQVAG